MSRENEFDFISIHLPISDIELSGLDDPITFDVITWEEIAVTLRLFPSKSEARRAGWTGKPKPGFSQKKLKKRGILVTVLENF